MKATLLVLVAVLCLTFVASAADISGKWVTDTSAAPAGAPAGGGRGGMGAGTYEFKVSGTTLTGSMTRPGFQGGDPTTTAMTDGKVAADGTFTFTITNNFGGNEFKTVYNGKIVGDKLEITFDMGGRGNPRTSTLKKAE